MSIASTIRPLVRQAWALWIYRWLIGVAFLFSAFSQLPDHRWTVGLGLLVFNAGIEAVLIVQQTQNAAQNALADEAERKTRHTIVAAAEKVGTEYIEGWDFWQEVNERVSAETGPQEPALNWWRSAGLVLGQLVWRLIADLFGIALVVTLTS